MKRKELTDLRSKEMKSLRKMVGDKNLEISKKKIEVVTGKEKNLKVVHNLKRDLSQILSVIKEKEILEKLQPKSSEAKEDKKK